MGGALQSLIKDEVVIAARPAAKATQGKAVKLATNFFRANFSNVPPIMHHDVRVERLRYDPETGARPLPQCSSCMPLAWQQC
jgi:hypothetical protein